MTGDKVAQLVEKYDREIPSVCSFRFKNKMAKADDSKFDEVMNTPIKSRPKTLLLSFLGAFGLHRFYLGDKKIAWLRLIVTIATILYTISVLVLGLSILSKFEADIDGNQLMFLLNTETNPYAVGFIIYAVLDVVVLFASLIWDITEMVRSFEDVKFVNYEILVTKALGTDKNLYKAESSDVEE